MGSNTYLRRGEVELSSRTPVHLVCYFRYYAFYDSGAFVYRTSPTPPREQRAFARGARFALRHLPGALSGELALSADGAGVHTVMTQCRGRVTHLHTWLRLRSTLPGANNRLDVRSMVAIDDGAEAPPEPDADYDAYSAPDGGGWHAAIAGWGAWEQGGAARPLSRGLTPYVFVPFEELDSTELNASAEEMDYYVPG